MKKSLSLMALGLSVIVAGCTSATNNTTGSTSSTDYTSSNSYISSDAYISSDQGVMVSESGSMMNVSSGAVYSSVSSY